MAQPGSSTITQSPGCSRVRLTMSSAWVAPTVVMICCGLAGIDQKARALDFQQHGQTVFPEKGRSGIDRNTVVHGHGEFYVHSFCLPQTDDAKKIMNQLHKTRLQGRKYGHLQDDTHNPDDRWFHFQGRASMRSVPATMSVPRKVVPKPMIVLGGEGASELVVRVKNRIPIPP